MFIFLTWQKSRHIFNLLLAIPQQHFVTQNVPLVNVCPEEESQRSSKDSDFVTFRHNPTDGSFAPAYTHILRNGRGCCSCKDGQISVDGSVRLLSSLQLPVCKSSCDAGGKECLYPSTITRVPLLVANVSRARILT